MEQKWLIIREKSMINPVQDGMPGWLKGIDLDDLAEIIENGKVGPIYRDYIIYPYFHHSKSSDGLAVWPKEQSTPNNPYKKVTRGYDWADGDEGDIFMELPIRYTQRLVSIQSDSQRIGFRIVRNA